MTERDEMPMWQILTLSALALIAVDAIAFLYAVNTGWRYPFMLCAIVNMCIVLATHVAGITWLLVRRR